MPALQRALRRWDPVRVAVTGLGGAWLVLLVGYAIGAATVRPTSEGIIAAVGALAIAVTGFLYAWRPGAGGRIE
jgi:hypothetical protein